MSSWDDYFEDTEESWEESGSLIYVYKCKICNKDVGHYGRSMHIWYHKYKGEIV
jgi:hypothetical protein